MHYLSVLVDASANETATRTHDLLSNAMKKDAYLMNEMQLDVTTSAKWMTAQKLGVRKRNATRSSVQTRSEH
jgi:hypothetical protein